MSSSEIMLELCRRGDVASAAGDILLERLDQRSRGYTPESDSGYVFGELIDAAIAYLKTADVAAQVTEGRLDDGDAAGLVDEIRGDTWPFDDETFKPRTQRDDLVRAAALVLAELERFDFVAAGGMPKA